MAIKYCEKHDLWYDYKEGCPECTKFSRTTGKILGTVIGAAVGGTVLAGKAIGKAIKNERNKTSSSQSPVVLLGCEAVHNVLIGDQDSMVIHVHFAISDALNQDVECSAYFYNSKRERLLDYNGLYNSADGQVSVGTHVKPRFQCCEYSDLQISIPYSEFHLAAGNYNLCYCLCVFVNGKMVFISDYYYFTYQSQSNNNHVNNPSIEGRPFFSDRQTDRDKKTSLARGIVIAIGVIAAAALLFMLIGIALGL